MNKNKKILLFLLLVFLSFTSALGVFAMSEIKSRSFNDVACKIIRLHIIANSDSDKDQALKLKVRDAVVNYMEKQAVNLEDVNDAREFLKSHTDDITALASSVLKENDCDDPVNAYLTHCHFPDKKYGDTLFPEGDYEAYRIEIGNASGHNWWCVLYPPLCFMDQATEDIPATSEESPESDDSEDSYEIRFKLLDWLHSAL